jgi:hypothetical protein
MRTHFPPVREACLSCWDKEIVGLRIEVLLPLFLVPPEFTLFESNGIQVRPK